MFDKIYYNCKICKKPIEVSEYNDTFIFDGKHYWHNDCFINYKMNLKIGKWNLEKCQNEINKLQKNTHLSIKLDNEKRLLYEWIFNYYQINFFPQYMYTKFETIFNGSYKGLNIAVPPTDLLNMWQMKKKYLENMHIRYRNKGKQIENGVSRILYDLSVLLSKYDSYLEWKRNKEIEKQQITNRCKNKIDYDNLIKNNNSDIANKNKINISDILDEI